MPGWGPFDVGIRFDCQQEKLGYHGCFLVLGNRSICGNHLLIMACGILVRIIIIVFFFFLFRNCEFDRK